MIWVLLAFFVLSNFIFANELEQAIKALEIEDCATAAPLLENVVVEQPKNIEVQFNLAYCYNQLQQNDKAIDHYQKTIDLKPGLPEAHMNLAIMLMAQNQVGEALPHLRIAIKSWPKRVKPRLYYAHALLGAGESAAAAAAYQSVISIDPLSADAHLGLGQALLRSGRPKEASFSYKRAVELNSDFESVQLELAEHFEQNGSPEQALHLYKRYLSNNPGVMAVRQRIGYLLIDLKYYSEAIEFFEQEIKHHPTIDHHIALAEAYLNTDKPPKALPHLEKAIATKDADPKLRLYYANLLLHGERFSEAAIHYLKLLEQTPNSVVAWNGLAFAMYKTDDLIGGLNALIKSDQAGTPKPAQVYLRAIIEDKLELRKEALASYRQFLALKSGLEDEEWKASERTKVIERSLRKR